MHTLVITCNSLCKGRQLAPPPQGVLHIVNCTRRLCPRGVKLHKEALPKRGCMAPWVNVSCYWLRAQRKERQNAPRHKKEWSYSLSGCSENRAYNWPCPFFTLVLCERIAKFNDILVFVGFAQNNRL